MDLKANEMKHRRDLASENNGTGWETFYWSTFSQSIGGLAEPAVTFHPHPRHSVYFPFHTLNVSNAG